MEELIDKLMRVLGSTQVAVQSESEGRQLLRQQTELYRRFAGIFSKVSFMDGPQYGDVATSDYIKRRLISAADFLTSNPPYDKVVEERRLVICSLPILHDELVEDLAQFVSNPPLNRIRHDAIYFPYIALGALYIESAAFNTDFRNLGEPTGADAALLTVAISRYTAARTLEKSVPVLARNYTNEVLAAKTALDHFIAEADRSAIARRASLAEIKTSADTMTGQMTKLVADMANTEERLKNFEKTVREEGLLNRARDTWGDRYEEAKKSFRRSIWFIAGYVIVTLGAAALILFGVLPALAKMPVPDNTTVAITQQLGRLVVITLPVFVFLWTLRAVMRFHMRSMLMMDDARMRETMLDTYFMLTKEGKADERDRPLILWALFKQTPGHGPDGIEPPDFTEVINAGMNRLKGEG